MPASLPSPHPVSRLLLAALAALTLVALAVDLHWVRLEEQGRAIAGLHDFSQFPSALRDFERARGHDPGADPLVDEAELFIFVGAGPRAVAPLLAAVRLQPQEALAWRLLSQAAASSDPALASRADARWRRLSPPLAQRAR